MIEDGPWTGVPIGGIGAGSIGRTYRGDFRRWHLTIGEHHVESVPLAGFSIVVAGGGRRSGRMLSAYDGLTPAGWAPPMPVGSGEYHALFPRAWFTYEPDTLPIRVVEEQLSPIIPGDYESSALPLGIFTLTLENPTADEQTVSILLSWPDRLTRERGVTGPTRIESCRFAGATGARILAAAAGDGMPASMAIAVADDPAVVVSRRRSFGLTEAGTVWADLVDDAALDPGPGDGDGGTLEDGAAERATAVAATVVLQAGERHSVRFAIAWDLPFGLFGDDRRLPRRHTRRYGTAGMSAFDIAAEGLSRVDGWRSAIEAWQDPILADPERPTWYKTALFNELYYLLDGGSLWSDDGPAAEPGRFALLECFDYPFYNTLDVDFYASWALLRLWPDLERSVARSFIATVDLEDPEMVVIEATGRRARRKRRGALPHDLGGPGEDPFGRPNAYRFQDVNDWKDLNSKFVLRLWRDRVVTGDDGLVHDAWPAIRQALDHLARTDHDGDGLPEHDGPDQTYDTWPMHGPTAYGGSLWLAALAAAVEIAAIVGDDASRSRYVALLEAARGSFEADLWRGDRYAFDGSGTESIMADQLVGQWYADTTGLGDLVAPDRTLATLRTIHRLNVLAFADGRMGPVNGMCPDGRVDTSSEQSQEVWVGTAYSLAAFMIGRGLVDEGWQTARGVAEVTYERGLWFRTPEAYDANGDFRAALYLRPMAIWAIEEALERRAAAGLTPPLALGDDRRVDLDLREVGGER